MLFQVRNVGFLCPSRKETGREIVILVAAKTNVLLAIMETIRYDLEIELKDSKPNFANLRQENLTWGISCIRIRTRGGIYGKILYRISRLES